MKKIFIFIFIFVFHLNSYAMSINSMLIVSDNNGNGVFTIKNNENTPIFIDVKLAKVSIDNGRLIKKNYTKDNLSTWEVSVNNNKFILDAGMQKNIGVQSLCSSSCNLKQDNIYTVQFTPTPYSKDDRLDSGININYGYEGVFIIPAVSKNISYSMARHGNIINIKNDSNTTLEMTFDECQGRNGERCLTKTILLPKKVRSIKLQKNTIHNVVNVTVNSVDEKFFRKEAIYNEKNIFFKNEDSM
ncbi:TPA: hypothetical protein ACX6PX_000472 [Photobacterium damselae]